MTYISLRTFQPTNERSSTVARRLAIALTAVLRWYQLARQRRALASLSMPELKDLGYPADQSPADVASRGRPIR